MTTTTQPNPSYHRGTVAESAIDRGIGSLPMTTVDSALRHTLDEEGSPGAAIPLPAGPNSDPGGWGPPQLRRSTFPVPALRPGANPAVELQTRPFDCNRGQSPACQGALASSAGACSSFNNLWRSLRARYAPVLPASFPFCTCCFPRVVGGRITAWVAEGRTVRESGGLVGQTAGPVRWSRPAISHKQGLAGQVA